MSVHHTVENVYLRQDAVRLTRKHLWCLLGMLLIVTAVSAALEFALTTLGDVITAPETLAAVTAMERFSQAQAITSTAPMTEAMLALFSSPKFLLFNLFYGVLTALVTHGLALGQQTQLLIAGRGGVPKVLGVFGQMRFCLKAWGLSLLTGLKLIGWLLPGAALILLGAALSLNDSALTGALCGAGMGLMIVLVIPAILRYALAPMILADNPRRGLRECILMSKVLMKGRKWQYFKLDIPMFLKMMGVFYAVSLVGTLVLSAAGLEQNPVAIIVLLLAATLPCVYFSLQMDMVSALFCIKRLEPEAAPQESPSPELPAEPTEELPENIIPETNEEKENPDEQPVC